MNHTEKFLGESKSLKVDAIQAQVKFLQGKVLTVIDASYSDKEQKKAVKDLVNKAFSDQLSYIMQLCYPDIRMMTSDEAESIIEDHDKIVAEAEVLES